MSLLFVHGHKFRRVAGEYYSLGGLQEDVLRRYIDLFGSMVVVGRIIDEDAAQENYKKIQDPRVKIVDNSELERLVQETDAVIVRLPSMNGYKAVDLAKKYGKPYLVEVVACVWDAYWNYSLKGKLAAAPFMQIMKKRVKDAPYVLYVSQNFLQKRYPTSGKTVGVSDVEPECVDERVLNARLDKIERNDGKLVLGTIGAVDVAHKGQEYAIRALPKLIERLGDRVEYQLVGMGSSERLAAIAREVGVEKRVNFIGALPHEDVFKWLDSIDLYVQPSFQEGLCRSLVEAIGRAAPAAASQVGGNLEIVEKEFSFSVKNKGKIADRIADVLCKLADKETMKKAAKTNFARALADFEPTNLERKRMTFYREFHEYVYGSPSGSSKE